jgi:ankyrin repeat protein
MYKAKDVKIDVDLPLDQIGKTYLHLAVEYRVPKIVSFLMFENQADPNLLTHNSQMGALHLAVHRMFHAIVELLLLNKRTNINLVSPLHGTPLHLASRSGSIKLV